MIFLDKVSLKYNKKEVLKDFSLKIKENEIYIIYGKSGIGKSSLLSIIGGVKNNTDGIVTYDGIKKENSQKLLKWKNDNVGYLDQEIRLINSISVWDNIFLPVILSKSKQRISDTLKEKAEFLLDYFDLLSYKKISPSTLSGGEKRRVEFIRTVIGSPKYILLDEPTNGLDEMNVIKMCKELDHLKRKSTIIVSTHDKRISQYLEGEEIFLNEEKDCL